MVRAHVGVLSTCCHKSGRTTDLPLGSLCANYSLAAAERSAEADLRRAVRSDSGVGLDKSQPARNLPSGFARPWRQSLNPAWPLWSSADARLSKAVPTPLKSLGSAFLNAKDSCVLDPFGSFPPRCGGSGTIFPASIISTTECPFIFFETSTYLGLLWACWILIGTASRGGRWGPRQAPRCSRCWLLKTHKIHAVGKIWGCKYQQGRQQTYCWQYLLCMRSMRADISALPRQNPVECALRVVFKSLLHSLPALTLEDPVLQFFTTPPQPTRCVQKLLLNFEAWNMWAKT